MKTGRKTEVQQEAFGRLVEEGVYGADFSHPAPARQFFHDVMDEELARLSARGTGSVLDCGCGPGAWLAEARAVADAGGIEFFGFDITPEMVEVARRRLGPAIPAQNLRQGNALLAESFEFPGHAGGFDIIFTYDVVQQLPRRQQFAAVQTIIGRLTPGGVAIIFDQDCRTPFGRKMGLKKFVTRYFRIDLVPRYYCNASYPPLASFGSRVMRSGRFETRIRVAAEGQKRALVIRSTQQ